MVFYLKIVGKVILHLYSETYFCFSILYYLLLLLFKTIEIYSLNICVIN